MKKPPINPQEHERLYQYYQELTPNDRLVRSGHALLSMALKPEVTWHAETAAATQEHIAQDKPLLLFLKHIRVLDVVLPAVLLKQEPELNPLIGNARILAHAGIFKNDFARTVLDNLGAIPVFRPSKINDFGGQTVSGVTDSLLTTVDVCLDKRQSIAVFPEGGFHPNHPDVVAPLGRAMVRLAANEAHADNVLPLAIGIAYKEASHVGPPQIALHLSSIEPVTGLPHEIAGEIIRTQMKSATLAAQEAL